MICAWSSKSKPSNNSGGSGAVAAIVMGLGAPTTGSAAARECPIAPAGVPCHGTTIESAYTYSGYHEGDLSLIWTKLSPQHKVGTTYVSAEPVPGIRQVFKRTLTWHSLPDVEIVAAYEYEDVGRGFRHKQLPTGTAATSR